jgi:hypothetical protein
MFIDCEMEKEISLHLFNQSSHGVAFFDNETDPGLIPPTKSLTDSDLCQI